MSYLGPSLRRAPRRSSSSARVLAAIVCSLLLNVLLLWSIDLGGIVGGMKPEDVRPVVLAPLSPSQWDANRQAQGPSRQRPAEPPPVLAEPVPTPPPNKVKGQVVDVQPSKDQTPPKDSRFIAEHDSTVAKETRSRDARTGYENTLAKPSSPKPEERSSPERGRTAAAPAGKPGVSAPGEGLQRSPKHEAAPRRHASPEVAPREKLALGTAPNGDLPKLSQRPGQRGTLGTLTPGGQAPSATPGEQGPRGERAPPGDLQLRPSAAAYDRLAGGPAPDKLDGVEEGEGTYLNTRGWKYAGYFNRISQAVREQWDPNGAMRARDPEGTRFASHDWFTLLVVKLDDRGSVKDISVQRSSGLDFLDNAAVQALRKAQPFVNPPHGLADERGEIVFSYGFTLEGSLGLDRIFRRRSSD